MTSPFTAVFDPDLSDNPSFVDLAAYWQRKCAGRPLPLKSEIDPLELKSHLGSLGMIECLPGLEDFRFRLIGSHIVQAYGRDSTGRTVRELYAESDPEYLDFLLQLYRGVVSRKAIARASGSLRPVGREYRQFDLLLLPLDGGDGTVGWMLNELLVS